MRTELKASKSIKATERFHITWLTHPEISDRLWRQEEQKLLLFVSISYIYSNRRFLGHGCLVFFHRAPSHPIPSPETCRGSAEVCGGGETEEKLLLKQLFMQETAIAKAQNSRRITDEALCRYDKISTIANEQYVNVLLYSAEEHRSRLG